MLVRTLLAMLACSVLKAQVNIKPGHIFFSKSFPGSTPEYFSVDLDGTGKAVYKQAPDDDQPLRFDLPAKDTAEIFELAGKLQFFRVPLESKLKVANMGLKTIRYENGEIRGEVKFNYSEDADARALVDWFEKISETEQHRISLERAARFDRLGVNKALLLLETSWDRRRIVAPEQLLPVLDRIAGHRNYLHIAQARAAAIAEKIRAGAQQK
jgi:hypothetical protein